jgi:hypothetical protein
MTAKSHIAITSVSGRIIESLIMHHNKPAYDFQIAERIGCEDIPNAELEDLVKAGILEKACSYSLTIKGKLELNSNK